MTQFATALLNWFDQHGRKDLPWQHNRTAYRVWLSEIMLQQTQVSTVIPYFQAFTERFPTVHDLANADQDEVLHLWTGLGYYARARNLHKCAQVVSQELHGVFPDTVEALAELPGIGRSTAGAIVSIAFQKPATILDGNVKRVLTRFLNLHGWPGTKRIENQLWQKAEEFSPSDRPDDYTQAIMDLGATLCTRSKPACELCPLAPSCEGLKTNNVHQLPTPKPKKAKPTKHTYMLMMQSEQGVLLHQRPATGIWGGLYSFPEFPSKEALISQLQQDGITEDAISWSPFIHTFSHYHLNIHPVQIRTKVKQRIAEPAAIWYHSASHSVGLAAPVKKLIQKLEDAL